MKMFKFILSYVAFSICFMLSASAGNALHISDITVSKTSNNKHHKLSTTQIGSYVFTEPKIEVIGSGSDAEPVLLEKTTNVYATVTSLSFRLSLLNTITVRIYAQKAFSTAYLRAILFPFHSFL